MSQIATSSPIISKGWVVAFWIVCGCIIIGLVVIICVGVIYKCIRRKLFNLKRNSPVTSHELDKLIPQPHQQAQILQPEDRAPEAQPDQQAQIHKLKEPASDIQLVRQDRYNVFGKLDSDVRQNLNHVLSKPNVLPGYKNVVMGGPRFSLLPVSQSNLGIPAGTQDAHNTGPQVALESVPSAPLLSDQNIDDFSSGRRIDAPHGDKVATHTQLPSSLPMMELKPGELYSQNLKTPAAELIEVSGMCTLIYKNEPNIFLLVNSNTHKTTDLRAISLSTKQVERITLQSIGMQEQIPQGKVVRVAYDANTLALLLIIETSTNRVNVNSKQKHCLVALYYDQAKNIWHPAEPKTFPYDENLGDLVCYDSSTILLGSKESHLFSFELAKLHRHMKPVLNINTDAEERFSHFAVTCIDNIILIAFSREKSVDLYHLNTENDKNMTLEKSSYSYPIKEPQMLLFCNELLLVLVTDRDQHPMQQYIVPLVASYSNASCNLKPKPARLHLSEDVIVGRWCFVDGRLYVWDLYSEKLISYIIPTEQSFNNQHERKYAEETACASSQERQSKDN